jgi:hypothetical protein
VSLLWGPVAALLSAAAVAGAMRRRFPACAGGLRRLAAYVGVLGVVTLGVLPVPVVVSTASALETQAFLLVCLAALGFVAEELLRVAVAGAALMAARPRRQSAPEVGEVVQPRA